MACRGITAAPSGPDGRDRRDSCSVVAIFLLFLVCVRGWRETLFPGAFRVMRFSPEAATYLPGYVLPRPSGQGGIYRPRCLGAASHYTPSPLAVLANLGVGWSRTTHRDDYPKGTDTMPRYEAYLGVNKPQTLAAGEGEPDAKYGVVHQNHRSGEISWVGGFAHYGTAMAALNANTHHLGFGILCQLRAVDPLPAQEYRFLNGVPVQVAQNA